MDRIVDMSGTRKSNNYNRSFILTMITLILITAAPGYATPTANISGNITLITSLGQNWYQQGINGLDSNGWGWTFFDESFSNSGYSSGYITPPEKVTQRNNIYALLLDSGNNSSPIMGAQVTANITFWTYDGANYTNKTSQIQLTEDTNHSGFYSGIFYFYGNSGYQGGCSYCHPAHGGKLQVGQFPGNYTATITAQVKDKNSTAHLSFEVTPWGCEDCHGSPNAHQTKLLNLDENCYLCHGLNQLVHRQDDAGNPHQNTAHRNIQCTDCHTNKSLNPDTFNGVKFTPGGINNSKSVPQYNYITTQPNSGLHTNLSCTDCHKDLTLSPPWGGFKQDNYTIQNTINNYTPDFASIQQFQDYYLINVTPEGPLNVTLNWEGPSNIGFYLYPPNFNPRNRTSPFSPDKGDYPYYNGSTFTNKPENYTNNTPLPGIWILAVYGYNLTNFWVGMVQPTLNYTIYSTYPIQQKNLPTVPECNSCHNSKASGKAFTKDQIPDWKSGFAHADTNKDGTLDVQCRMCHDAMHNITIKSCQNCHTTAPENHPISEPAFTLYTPGQCLACHGDPHNVIVAGGDTCIECHGTNYSGASPSVNQTFVNISAFNESIHQNINSTPPATLNNVDCWSCHYNKDMNRSNVKKCGDCHRKPSQWHGNANITTDLSQLW
ncbi:Cytochrome c3 [uncultured archaeon]|nr:Cytochrome c3 [uncultured archaeon]